MFKNLLLATTALFLLSGCFGGPQEEKWSAFIYPDKNNTKRNMKSPMTFETLQECKDESIKQIDRMNLKGSATFKCGLNCEFHDGMKVEICEKMLAPTDEFKSSATKK